jgi:O-antigen ligase
MALFYSPYSIIISIVVLRFSDRIKSYYRPLTSFTLPILVPIIPHYFADRLSIATRKPSESISRFGITLYLTSARLISLFILSK